MLTDFAVHRGHVFAEKQGPIPKKIEIITDDQSDQENYGFWAKVKEAINQMFESMGLSFVPKWCRYAFILICVTSPFWIVSCMMIFDEFDQEEVKASERTSKLMRELKRKERMERKNERVN